MGLQGRQQDHAGEVAAESGTPDGSSDLVPTRCEPDWPAGSEESEAASDPVPPLPRTAMAPVVRAAASRKVHTTLSAECGNAGGFSGRYAPVEMESDVRIAVLRASSTAARN